MPTGNVATAQCRSRVNSEESAKSALFEQLSNDARYRHAIEVARDRKNQIGSGMRGDKIRTYRFQDDVVKDHRTEKTSSVKYVMKGNFDVFWPT